MFTKKTIFSIAVVLSLSTVLQATDKVVTFTVSSEVDGADVPVSVAVEADQAFVHATVTNAAGHSIPAQLTGPSLLSNSQLRELHMIVPKVLSGKTAEYRATLSTIAKNERPSFSWDVNPGKTATLALSGRKILKYMFEHVDDSSPERRMETYKVFHHVFDPTGTFLVTKGPGGLYPHHRGLFFGFNRISYGENQKADIWHCRNGESQIHTNFVATESGPVLGRHQLAIDWNGQDGKPFAKETRELTVYNVPGGTLIEFATMLVPTDGPVRLDGDPQHAGFQFRGSQHIAEKTKDKTYYLRPDGRGQPGEFRNWKNPGDAHANLPWNAQSFVINDQRFTCCYLDHPKNPKESRFSERDYGRFGSYFEYELSTEQVLRLNYQIWLQQGETTGEVVSARSNIFVNRPVASLN